MMRKTHTLNLMFVAATLVIATPAPAAVTTTSEVLCENQDIVAAFPEWRQGHDLERQPIQQVGAKTTLPG